MCCAFLLFEEKGDLDGLRDIVFIHLMLGLETLANSLTDQARCERVEIAVPEPPCHPRFCHLVPQWRVGQSANRIVMDAMLAIVPAAAALRSARTPRNPGQEARCA